MTLTREFREDLSGEVTFEQEPGGGGGRRGGRRKGGGGGGEGEEEEEEQLATGRVREQPRGWNSLNKLKGQLLSISVREVKLTTFFPLRAN